MFLQTCSWNITWHIFCTLPVDSPMQHATQGQALRTGLWPATSYLPFALLHKAYKILPQCQMLLVKQWKNKLPVRDAKKSNFDILFFFLFWQNLKLMFLQSCSYNIQQILLPLRVNGDVRHAAKKVERWAEASSMPIPAVIPIALLHKSHNSLPQSHTLHVSKKNI